MSDPLTLALISGGVSPERAVSIASADQVYEALDKSKYRILRYDPKTDLAKLVTDAQKIDAALIILHGPYGEDGTIQGLLDLLGIPYQGAGVLGSAVAMNKLAAKELYVKNQVPVPPYRVIRPHDAVDMDEIIAEFGLPLVVKPVECGSSIGLTIVRTKDQLAPALAASFAQDPETALVEAFIQGRELTVGVLGNRELTALPAIEIIPGKEYAFFTYDAKYLPGASREICPAHIPDDVAAHAADLAVKAHKAVFCRGYSRTDMMMRENELFVLETNTIPGMTATSLLPQAAKAAGYSFPHLLDELIRLGMEARRKIPEPNE